MVSSVKMMEKVYHLYFKFLLKLILKAAQRKFTTDWGNE